MATAGLTLHMWSPPVRRRVAQPNPELTGSQNRLVTKVCNKHGNLSETRENGGAESQRQMDGDELATGTMV